MVKGKFTGCIPIGNPPPRGYIQWHEWAKRQKKQQTLCSICDRWRFPQEQCTDFKDKS